MNGLKKERLSKVKLNSYMNKYVISVRVKGIATKTIVFADGSLHALLICQYLFGSNNVIGGATQVSNEDNSVGMLDEVAKFIKPIKPLTPQQTRIDGLKKQKDSIAKQLNAERDRQKLAKAQQQIFKATH